MGGRGASVGSAAEQAPISRKSIENMNAGEIRAAITGIDSEIATTNAAIAANAQGETYGGAFPLGAGFRDDKQYVANIEKTVTSAKRTKALIEKRDALAAKKQALKDAAKDAQGGGTQKAAYKQKIDNLASSSTTKWSTQSGTKSIKSGDYEIATVGGSRFVYKAGRQIGITNSLKEAKVLVDLLEKRARR